jgi:hypothetical protein
MSYVLKLSLTAIFLLLYLPGAAQAPDRTFARAGQIEGTLRYVGPAFLWQAQQTVTPDRLTWRIQSPQASNADLGLTLEVGVVYREPATGEEYFIRYYSATLGKEAARALRDGLAHSYPVGETAAQAGPR